jgi:peptide/nickel transport system permease protein
VSLDRRTPGEDLGPLAGVGVRRQPRAFRRGLVARLPLPTLLKRILSNPLSFMGVVLVLAFAIVAIAAPLLAPPKDPENAYRIPRDGFKAEPQPPSAKHLFGTTEGQYDIYYGVVWGTRTAFKVGLIITAVTALIGLVVGSLAAFYGGWLEEVLMRIVEVFMAFPFLLAAITIAAVIKTKAPQMEGVYVAMLAIIAFAWMSYARLIRGDILTTKERDFVLAARSIGVGNMRLLIRHVLPNSLYPTLVVASMDIGSYVLTFSALSFLGLGAELGYADWGQMIAFARNWIPALAKYWYIVVFPGGAIVLFVLAWNLIGDALRDILDPRLRGLRGA